MAQLLGMREIGDSPLSENKLTTLEGTVETGILFPPLQSGSTDFKMSCSFVETPVS